ncbi:FAD dependent oxidoreductase [Amanita muscaria]
MVLQDDRIVIVGAGCFGISTAYHLLKRGFKNISIIERSDELPAKDAASNDINRIVRSSYSDPFYANLGREAIHSWRNREEWGDSYHESGLLNVFSTVEQSGKSYADDSYRNDVALGARVKELIGGDAIRSVFPESVHLGSFASRNGYINYDCGWANAGQGLSLMIQKVRDLGGEFILGKTVCNLLREEGRTVGVQCADGSTYPAAVVILSIGSWTASALPNLRLEKNCLATGQCIATMQLTEEEAARYRGCPVLLDLTTGFYVFPPTNGHVVKVAIHNFGLTNSMAVAGEESPAKISTPRTITSDPVRGLCIPKVALRKLRSHLREFFPDLAQKPFSGTRLCWYNDTPDGSWIIGYYPNDAGLMMATGGNGHAYKFLPVIGQIVADACEGNLDPALVSKFAVDRVYNDTDGSRSGVPSELDLEDLCTEKDLSLVDA